LSTNFGVTKNLQTLSRLKNLTYEYGTNESHTCKVVDSDEVGAMYVGIMED
jgi:hypothetical protein